MRAITFSNLIPRELKKGRKSVIVILAQVLDRKRPWKANISAPLTSQQ